MSESYESPIFGLSAPSACGKTWLLRKLIQDEIVTGWASHTTRPARLNEYSTNYDHIFVTDQEFQKLAEAGKFVIAATLYGNEYGLCKPRSAHAPQLVLLKPQVIGQFKDAFGDRAVIYGIHSENGDQCAERLMRERGQSDEDIYNRLQLYDKEIQVNQELIPASHYFVAEGHPGEIYSDIVRAIEQQYNRAYATVC